jgi:hypothetical protein
MLYTQHEFSSVSQAALQTLKRRERVTREAMGPASTSKPFHVASISIDRDRVERERHSILPVRDPMVELSIDPVVDEAS